MIRSRSLLTPLALAVALAGCAIGPDYQRPELTVPASFKEGEGWQLAKPQDGFNHGAWWELYGDATLNDLQTRLVAANQTLAQSGFYQQKYFQQYFQPTLHLMIDV